jgi:hypothetical protein
MRRNEDEMDNQKLADLLFPEVVNTPEYYEEKFPYRKLPNKAEVTRMSPRSNLPIVCCFGSKYRSRVSERPIMRRASDH